LKALILGIGNPILRDDGVGPRLIEELRPLISDPRVTLQHTSAAGFNLMDLLAGFDVAIIVDAIQTGARPGKIHWLRQEDIPLADADTGSQHSMTLFQAIDLGRRLGHPMPEKLTVAAIEAKDVTSFGEELSPEVEKAVMAARKQILTEVNKMLANYEP